MKYLTIILSILALALLAGCASPPAVTVTATPPTVTVTPAAVTVTPPPVTVTVTPEAVKNEVTPAPTGTSSPAQSTTSPALKTEADIEQYLKQNYSTCQTSIGPTSFTFLALENDSYLYPYDYWIAVEYDFSFFYDIQYSKDVSADMNHKVCKELKDFQEKLAKDIIALMPDKKLWGGYYYSWYKYPAIQEGLEVRRYYSWVNYSPASILTEYDQATITGFAWYPTIDDTLTR
jgi:hypothetical protein